MAGLAQDAALDGGVFGWNLDQADHLAGGLHLGALGNDPVRTDEGAAPFGMGRAADHLFGDGLVHRLGVFHPRGRLRDHDRLGDGAIGGGDDAVLHPRRLNHHLAFGPVVDGRYRALLAPAGADHHPLGIGFIGGRQADPREALARMGRRRHVHRDVPRNRAVDRIRRQGPA